MQLSHVFEWLSLLLDQEEQGQGAGNGVASGEIGPAQSGLTFLLG